MSSVNIKLESDSAILGHALESTEYDLTPEGVIFRELRSFLQLNFISAQVAHAPRCCNNAAHLMAAMGANQQEPRLLWLDYVPEDVNVVVASESAVPI